MRNTITPDLPSNVPLHCRKNVRMVSKSGAFGTIYAYDRDDGLEGRFCITPTGGIHHFPAPVPSKNAGKKVPGVRKKTRARNLHILKDQTHEDDALKEEIPEVIVPVEVQEVQEVVQEKVQEIQELPPIPIYQAPTKPPEKKIQGAPATSFFLNKFPPGWRGGIERERDQGELGELGIVYKCKKTRGWLRCRFIILHDGQVVNLGVLASGKSKHAQEVNTLPSREEAQVKIKKFFEEPPPPEPVIPTGETPVKRGPGRPT
ncbi:MAG: hypothetical protein Q8K26_01345, partial [Candidatus Gracilibacteria bacterium]|nr:hypothetical protein [Candidatus Gracilibacteria bacterium]